MRRPTRSPIWTPTGNRAFRTEVAGGAMEPYRLKHDKEGRPRLEVPYRGQRLPPHPMFHQSNGFHREERTTPGLEGLLPDAVSTLEQQVRRVYRNIVRKQDPLERYVGLAALQD